MKHSQGADFLRFHRNRLFSPMNGRKVYESLDLGAKSEWLPNGLRDRGWGYDVLSSDLKWVED